MILRRDIPSSGWKKNKSKHGTCFNHGTGQLPMTAWGHALLYSSPSAQHAI
jgi:hypothetical protein